MIYEKIPKDFNPSFEVCVAKISVMGETLFLQRSKDEEFPLTWSLPGGSIETGETKEEAMHREIKEELNLELNSKYIKTLYVRYPKKDFLYHMFKASPEKKPAIKLNNEHVTYSWLKIADALKLDLIPGEEDCLRLFD